MAQQGNVRLVGIGQKPMFPANFFHSQMVGREIVLQFFFDDGTTDPGLAVAFLSSLDSAKGMIERAESLTLPNLTGQPAIWYPKKQFNLADHPVRVSHAAFVPAYDLVSCAFAFIHPAIVAEQSRQMVAKKEGESADIPIDIPVAGEIMLEAVQFKGWIMQLKDIVKEV